jgi:hypothetical protein
MPMARRGVEIILDAIASNVLVRGVRFLYYCDDDCVYDENLLFAVEK